MQCYNAQLDKKIFRINKILDFNESVKLFNSLYIRFTNRVEFVLH